jgi:hypothetical protein
MLMSPESIEGHMEQGPWVSPKHDILSDTNKGSARCCRVRAARAQCQARVGPSSQP